MTDQWTHFVTKRKVVIRWLSVDVHKCAQSVQLFCDILTRNNIKQNYVVSHAVFLLVFWGRFFNLEGPNGQKKESQCVDLNVVY